MQSLFSHQRLAVPFPWSGLNNASFAAPLWFQEHIHFILVDLAQQAMLGFPSSICFCQYFQAFLQALERAGDFNYPQRRAPNFQAPIPLLLSSSSSISKVHFQIVFSFWNGLFVYWSWRQASEVNSGRCLQKKQNVRHLCSIPWVNSRCHGRGNPGPGERPGAAASGRVWHPQPPWPGLGCESEFGGLVWVRAHPQPGDG